MSDTTKFTQVLAGVPSTYRTAWIMGGLLLSWQLLAVQEGVALQIKQACDRNIYNTHTERDSIHNNDLYK